MDDRIWAATLKNKRDIPTNICNFLSKAVHNSHKIGEYWKKIQNYEHRGICQKCEKTENLDHILFDCLYNQSQTIWDTIKLLCAQKKITWPTNMNTSHIIATLLWNLKDEEGLTRMGDSRALKTLMLKGAWQIWKLCCCRVINSTEENETKISKLEAHNTIKSALNNRLQSNKILTNRKKYSTKALPEKTALETWKNLLNVNADLPENWLKTNRVLVGIPDPLDWCEPHTQGTIPDSA
jgi:ribonuclease HI